MARVLVLTDRSPADADWKGAFAWDLIRELAESQHQVLVLTTVPPESIEITHPRLSIGHPAKNWGVQHLPKFLQGMLMFRPDVIHTFAPKHSRLLGAMTIWPYLHSACAVLPRVRRFSTFFEDGDLREKDPSLAWHRGSAMSTVFNEVQRNRMSQRFSLTSQVVPMERDNSRDVSPKVKRYVLIPAPVSDWTNSRENLKNLLTLLNENPELHAQIVGGWGDIPMSERRAGWHTLLPVAERVVLLEPLGFQEFRALVQGADKLWLECLPESSWRRVASTLASESVSAANFVSRLYAQF